MKKYLIIFMMALGLGIGQSSCSYLDISPDLGISEEDVFSTYKNYRLYFDNIYFGEMEEGGGKFPILKNAYPLYLDQANYRFTWYTLTDAADNGRIMRSAGIKKGFLGENVRVFTTPPGYRPIPVAMFKAIRIANQAIENIGMLQDATEEEKDDLLGQAHFVRAFAHMTMCNYFGGMPYLEKALGADDEWDMTRLSAHETYNKCAEDFQTAHDYLKKAGKMRRDGTVGQANHLHTHEEMMFPNGVAAIAMKARALMYAASSLNNKSGNEDWIKAAEACGEAILLAREWTYDLVEFENWGDNFYGTPYTNEQLWAWNYGTSVATGTWSGHLAYPMTGYSNAAGLCPTQNYVDKFETYKGDALNTEADRAAAVSAGNYNDQAPYDNRDPRFYKTIVYDGCRDNSQQGSNIINIHYDPGTGRWPSSTITDNSTPQDFGIEWGSNDAKGYTNTGYYCYKWWNGKYRSKTFHKTDPLVRLGEVYLNYAEAVNEAYGPNGTAGGMSETALDILNKVRGRAGMPPVQSKYTGSKDDLRPRIYNERCVELAYEGNHYYIDIRRWETAPQTMTQTLMGMYIEKVPVSSEYPKGRKYTRKAIPENRQATWKSAMYYIPFPAYQANKMKNFVNNEVW